MKFDFLSGSVFILTFGTLFFFMNYLPLAEVLHAYQLGHAIEISLLVTIAYISAHTIGSKYKHGVVNFFYKIAVAWLGTIFLAFCIYMPLLILRAFIPLTQLAIAHGILWSTLALAILSLYFGYTLVSKHHTVQMPKLHQKVRVVQLSDLHLTGLGARNYLAKVLARVQDTNPDVIAITGDLLDVPGLNDPEILKQFDQFKIPIVMVLGNHDRYLGVGTATHYLSPTHVTILRNQTHIIKGIEFIGVDDADRKGQLAKVLPTIVRDLSKTQVLLFHKPTETDFAEKSGVHLMLSGHTHFGQIFPFTLLVRAAYKYCRGLAKTGNMYIHTSPGTGTWAIPMRLGSRNEITILDLVPKVDK